MYGVAVGPKAMALIVEGTVGRRHVSHRPLEGLPGASQSSRIHGRKCGEVHDGLRTSMNIDGECPVMKVLGGAFLGKEAALVVVVSAEQAASKVVSPLIR